jgi:predicted DNA-binding WGR domain protein
MRQEWFNPSNGRRYLVELFEDLLGDWVLIRRWAGPSRSGNQKIAVMATYDAALSQFRRIEGKRQKRGYRKIEIFR